MPGACHLAHPLAADAMRLYTLVHESLLATLGRWQITARRHPGQAAEGSEPFLCFARRAAGDIVIDLPPQQGISGHKICGSAERRRQGAVVQHGSVLLQRSDAVRELPGIAELTGVQLSADLLAAAWQTHLQTSLGIEWQPAELTLAERDQVRTLAIEKYDTAAWNRRR